MSMLLYLKRKLTLAVAFAFFFCSAFAFVTEARANGNPYADWPPAVEPSRRPVQRAPIRRPSPRVQPQQRVEPPQPPPPPQPTLLERGILLMEQMRYTQARALLQRAVQEESNNPYAWYWLGMAHNRTGQLNQAQAFFSRALELDPAFAPFSRVVTYPDHGERIPLWDPLRPARIYPIELDSRGVMVVPPDAPGTGIRPAAPPVAPDLPRVPVYIPPSPHTISVQGTGAPVHGWPQPPAAPSQAASAPVYIPPQLHDAPVQTIGAPVYIMPFPSDAAVAPQPVYIPPPPPY
jgi:hypothetical protein